MEKVTPQSHPLLYSMIALRKPGGVQIGLTESQSIIKAVAEPENYWVQVKDIVIAPDGSTFETCLKAVTPTYQPGTTPTREQMESAIAFASR